MKPRTLILRTAGTNCDAETAYAFELAGAEPHRVHVNEFLRSPSLIADYQILAIPGGFSYGDDIAAGKILANQLMHYLRDALHDFVDAGKPVIGICNGFQVLVKTDLLPGSLGDRSGQTCTLTQNTSGRFVDRWVKLRETGGPCIWTKDLLESGDEPAVIELPVAHGEGRFVPATEAVREALWDQQQIALVYAREDGRPAAGAFPENPNGSTDDIAGVCDATGLVFGLMPHPERFVDATQHPAWTSRASARPHGVGFFRNAVHHAREALGVRA